MSTDYSDWVTVVTSDDQTPIWSGPEEEAHKWMSSPSGKSFARALAHQDATLTITDCIFK